LLRQALTALHFYTRDQHYILAPGEKPEDGLKVQIVDESTGRVMADRSWEQGLHQLIEAKEGVKLTAGRDTLARMTFQRFFRRYYLLAAGGLHVILTEYHESPRVDRQLFGRSGRQGQPGTVRALVAADDPIFKALPAPLRAALARGRALALAVRLAQGDAERRAWQMRKQTLRQDRELHRIIGIAGHTT
jgi:preprotein translocase subunit SecA